MRLTRGDRPIHPMPGASDSGAKPVVRVLLLLIACLVGSDAFHPTQHATHHRTNIHLAAKKPMTLGELKSMVAKNPDKYFKETQKKKKYRRSRKKSDNPQQSYVYASQKPKNITTTAVPVDEFKLVGQYCDHIVGEEPELIDSMVVEGSTRVYLVDKPAGWAILGEKVKSKSLPEATSPSREVEEDMDDADMSVDDDEFVDEALIRSMMTPEELEAYLEEIGEAPSSASARSKTAVTQAPDDSVAEARHRLEHETDLDSATRANLERIVARGARLSSEAHFAVAPRPSVVSWLKDYLLAKQDLTIRGGKYWTAVAGATQVDDSGLVLLCPKAQVGQILVECVDFVTVVGNGGHMAPRSKLPMMAQESVSMKILSKLRKGRGDDAVQTVQVTVTDFPASGAHVVQHCQASLQDGIRGDPLGHSLDRRASRRLIHCNGMSVSSLVEDAHVDARVDIFADDIAILADRKNHHSFRSGSFLGRSSLKMNPSTNCYREINGASDGFPGWVVDRYDKWLLVQHDPEFPRGPLPSIHDGNTLGVYYLESIQDRSSMGSDDARPRLIEGMAAPEVFPVIENGVTYMVSMDKDLSTGLFLDQRPHRAWLSRNCGKDTHVLNCFAHTGAFSVAAAVAGASTVSLDLSKKWLDRLPEHMAANDIAFDESHDRIYGDCFDWLVRLAKRNEMYDIVILDPPSTSVGGRKKKRWSISNDMDELVSLASRLVKSGGMLWTTTNSASISSTKFARLCRKGFDDAGLENVRLERIQPMPSDFQCTGPQPVKNLVWRLP